MLKKLFLIVLIALGGLFITTPAQAAGEFTFAYNVTYEVGNSGVTTVTEKVSLKNLTETQYASNFKLTIPATQIADVAASDAQGPLEVSSKVEGKKTNIVVSFAQQIAGKGKEYGFTLKFKSRDFAQNQGKVWQVAIPKISALGDNDQYQLTLIVPVSFGDPTSILPEPVKQSEVDNKLSLIFNKAQLTENGVVANFGTNQFFKFELGYNLENNGFLPKTMEVTLPGTSSYQLVLINSVEPRPETSYFDQDGNVIAQYKVDRGQKVAVKARGLAKLSASNGGKVTLSQTEIKQYTAFQKYWEKDSPQISARLAEIFQGKNAQTNQEKAKLIDKYVASALTYDDQRVKANDFQRLGALTILNNPQQALCQEFTDLFVTLARAAGIPARQLIGSAYSSNSDLRPLSLQSGSLLHAWAQYYDPSLGWVMIDPTWENTTGGVDYFAKFDLNHLSLVTRGVSSTGPTLPSEVKVEFTDQEFRPQPSSNLELMAPDYFYGGVPAQAKVKITNNGNIATDSAQLSLDSANLEITGVTKNNFITPKLPPGGVLEYQFDLKAKSPFDSKEDSLQLSWGDQKVTKKILIKPFFAHQLFGPVVIGTVSLMLGAYFTLVIFHFKYPQKLTLDLHKRKT